MRDENFSIHLSPKDAEVLRKLVEVAENTQSVTVWHSEVQSSTWTETFDHTFRRLRQKDSPDTFESISQTVQAVPGNPIYNLIALGYVFEEVNSNVVLNLQLAKQRVKYENRRKFGKWWMHVTNNRLRFVIDVGAVIAAIWSITDIILRIVGR